MGQDRVGMTRWRLMCNRSAAIHSALVGRSASSRVAAHTSHNATLRGPVPNQNRVGVRHRQQFSIGQQRSPIGSLWTLIMLAFLGLDGALAFQPLGGKIHNDTASPHDPAHPLVSSREHFFD
jgi:hypothetical protein